MLATFIHLWWFTRFWCGLKRLNRWSQWPSGLRCRSAAARMLRLWVRIPPGAWMSVCFMCCVLSGRGLCDGPITRPEESYWVWWDVVCDPETSWMRRIWPNVGLRRQIKKKRLNHWEVGVVLAYSQIRRQLRAHCGFYKLSFGQERVKGEGLAQSRRVF